MNYKLLKYYKENVSVDALVDSHMKNVNAILNLLFWSSILSLFAFVITGLLVNYLNNKGPFYISFSFFLVSLLCLLISMKIYIRRAKEIVRRTLGITSYGEKWRWRTEEFDNHQRNLIIDFLTEKNLMKKWKIEKVIDSLKKENNKNKVPPLIAPAIFFTLTVPNLTQFFTYLYKIKEGEAVTVFIYILTGTILLVIFLNQINQLIQKIKESFMGDFYHKDNLMSLLEEVLYTLNE
jgi:hypothetical protein